MGGLDLYNRGTAGSGHGWAIGNGQQYLTPLALKVIHSRWSGVGWNVQALGSITVQSPPYSRNLCIGCSARSYAKSDKDCYILKGTRVEPPSLFETQLQQRIGQEASAKILNSILGLSTNTESEPNSIMDRQCAPMRTWFNNTALMHLAQQGRRENNARIFDILLPGSFGVTGY